MTYTMSQQIRESVTLYRGESPERRRDISTYGLGGQIEAIEQLHLARLPVDLLGHLGYPEIARHVLDGSKHSPFTSWSLSRGMAAWYALAAGHREHGLLLEVTLRLESRTVWTNADDNWSTAFQDARGRQLIPTANFGALTARAVSWPEEVASIRALGSSDREYLVMGRIDPNEITVQSVRRPARRRGGTPQPSW